MQEEVTDLQVSNLPEELRVRLLAVNREVEVIIHDAAALMKTAIPPISLQFKHSAPGDMLTVEERAQSVSFVARYDLIAPTISVHLVERDHAWHIENFPTLAHALTDFRPLIQNRNDATYFQNVHNVWYRTLLRQDPAQGLTIRAYDEGERDITGMFAAWVGEHNRALKHLLAHFEYDYLFNGMLQHSDVRYAERFWNDYTSGELNFVVWKHVQPLGFIRSILYPYYVMNRVLTFPTLGPLWPKPSWVA